MRFGLEKKDLASIRKVFGRFPAVETVIIFGSRAMGNFKKGSDVDLALMGNVDPSTLNQVKFILNEDEPLPYFFDVITYNEIDHKELKDHIDQVGKLIYKK